MLLYEEKEIFVVEILGIICFSSKT